LKDFLAKSTSETTQLVVENLHAAVPVASTSWLTTSTWPLSHEIDALLPPRCFRQWSHTQRSALLCRCSAASSPTPHRLRLSPTWAAARAGFCVSVLLGHLHHESTRRNY